MSFKSLLHDDRYMSSDRFYNDRFYHDRYSNNHRNHPHWNNYPNSWNYHHNNYPNHYYNHHYSNDYWNHNSGRYTNWNPSHNGTLRFNKAMAPNTVTVPTETKVIKEESTYPTFYPFSPYTPPIWSAATRNSDLKRSNSIVNIQVEAEEDDNKSIKSCNMSKSCSNMQEPINVSYVYETDKDMKHRHVTYVKHAHEDGQSLEGNLVMASNDNTFLPTTRSVNVGPIFNGSSFGILSEHLTIRDTFHVSFQFKTTQQNGVLMSIVDRSSGDSFFIELYDSQLKATLFIDGEADSCWTDFDKPVLSNDIWSDVEVNIRNNKLCMAVRNERFTKTHRFPFRRPIRGDLFVAGYPTTASPPFVCRSRDFFVGEMRNFYLNNDGVKWYGTPATSSHSQHPRLGNWYY